MRSVLIAVIAVAIAWAEGPAPYKLAITRVFPQPGQIGIFIAAADGSGERPLLASADVDYDPVWAPDGKSIVFTSERNGSADLFRVNTDGSGLTQLTTDPAYDDQAAFSPDSKQLVFVSTRGGGMANLWTMDLATGRAKALTSGAGGDFRPSWSPDGKWIAFSSGRGNPMPFAHGRWERLQLADIYVIRPGGSGLKKITKSGDFCGSPKWMADSHVIAYCMTAEQTLANRRPSSRTGKRHAAGVDRLTTGARHGFARAVPGVKINPSSACRETRSATSGRTQPSRVSTIRAAGEDRAGPIRAASWSPDGNHVVFHKRLTLPRRRSFGEAVQPQSELRIEPDGNAARIQPFGQGVRDQQRPAPGIKGSALKRHHAWRPDFPRLSIRTRSGMCWRADGRPTGDRIIFGIGGFAAFFDGFHSHFLKPGDRVEGGAQVAIDQRGRERLPGAHVGTGQQCVPFVRSRRQSLRVPDLQQRTATGCGIMNLETKAVTTLTGEYDNFPLWSPRGDLIMFSRLMDGAYEIYTIKPDGSGLKRLTFTQGNDAHMAWSPDGEYIVFASSRMGFKDEVVYTDAPQPYGEIFVMRYDGTGVEQLTDNQWEEGTPGWQRVKL